MSRSKFFFFFWVEGKKVKESGKVRRIVSSKWWNQACCVGYSRSSWPLLVWLPSVLNLKTQLSRWLQARGAKQDENECRSVRCPRNSFSTAASLVWIRRSNVAAKLKVLKNYGFVCCVFIVYAHIRTRLCSLQDRPSVWVVVYYVYNLYTFTQSKSAASTVKVWFRSVWGVFSGIFFSILRFGMQNSLCNRWFGRYWVLLCSISVSRME